MLQMAVTPTPRRGKCYRLKRWLWIAVLFIFGLVQLMSLAMLTTVFHEQNMALTHSEFAVVWNPNPPLNTSDFPPFFIKRPVFVTKEDEEQFLNQYFETQIKESMEYEFNQTHSYLNGPYFLNAGHRIHRNVKLPTIRQFGECGGVNQRLNKAVLLQNENISQEIMNLIESIDDDINGTDLDFDGVSSFYVFHKIAFLDVWDSWSYQHFLDGVLTKWIKDYPLTKDFVIVLRGSSHSHFPAVTELADILGMRLLWESDLEHIFSEYKSNVFAKYFGNFCRAPSFHPITVQKLKHLIMRKASQKQGEHERQQLTAKTIVYFKRNTKRTSVRQVGNEKGVIRYLQSVFDAKHLLIFEYDSNRHTFLQQMASVRNAKLFIGPHGGALYNILWTAHNSKNVTVIELMPENAGIHSLFWLIAGCLEYDYVYLGCHCDDNKAETTHIEKLKQYLDSVDIAKFYP